MTRCFVSAAVSAIALQGCIASLAQEPSDPVLASIESVEEQVVAWRRDIHQNPELGNREFRTSKIVADHLRSLGMEVRTEIAVTGVLGVLKGGKPGPTIALRADMDALPMKELTGLPFASTVTAEYGFSKNVPVAHSCGHDAHTAMLLGAASVLSQYKDDIEGTILFVFQPAEEGPPPGETGGASRMLAEGLFEEYSPEAMFALHVEPGPVGQLFTRPDGFLAGATVVNIKVMGEGTHAARPWMGTDLLSLSADIIKAMSVISARRFNVLEEPAVITLAHMEAGTRSNILPPEATISGTLRTYSLERLSFIKSEIERSVEALATMYDADGEVSYGDPTPPTINNAALLRRVTPALEAAAGPPGLDVDSTPRPAAEDFSFFALEIPSVYVILGSTPNWTGYENAVANHSPQFDIDEDVLQVGVRTHVFLALDYLSDLSALRAS